MNSFLVLLQTLAWLDAAANMGFEVVTINTDLRVFNHYAASNVDVVTNKKNKALPLLPCKWGLRKVILARLSSKAIRTLTG